MLCAFRAFVLQFAGCLCQEKVSLEAERQEIEEEWARAVGRGPRRANDWGLDEKKQRRQDREARSLAAAEEAAAAAVRGSEVTAPPFAVCLLRLRG